MSFSSTISLVRAEQAARSVALRARRLLQGHAQLGPTRSPPPRAGWAPFTTPQYAP